MADVRCHAKTRKGDRCKNIPIEGKQYCRVHQENEAIEQISDKSKSSMKKFNELMKAGSVGATQHSILRLIDTMPQFKDSTEDNARQNLNDFFAIVNPIIEAVEPRDAVESLITSQLIATHFLFMDCGKLATTDRIDQKNHAVNWMSKLSRIFGNQIETLRKYRTGGEQKVTVEHVHVHSGGQAIVGNVETGTGGRGSTQNDEPSPGE